MARRIHIFGASGSGTTTLATALGERLGCPHFDVDDYFWLPTWPPFQAKRDRIERETMLLRDLDAHDSWALSGSLFGWGDIVIAHFTLAVFLYAPLDVRIQRLEKRAAQRFGDAILPGGHMHAQHIEFIEWAAQYDEDGKVYRNVHAHRKWLAALPCATLEISGDVPLADAVDRVLRAASPTGQHS